MKRSLMYVLPLLAAFLFAGTALAQTAAQQAATAAQAAQAAQNQANNVAALVQQNPNNLQILQSAISAEQAAATAENAAAQAASSAGETSVAQQEAAAAQQAALAAQNYSAVIQNLAGTATAPVNSLPNSSNNAPVTNATNNAPVTNASNNAPSGTGLLNPLQATSLTQLLQEILSYVVMLGGILLTIMLVYVGFLFVAARGNDEAIRRARSALLWTVVGGLILLGASALATVITTTVQGL